jgi:type IV pilus assembly protein PilB
MTLGRPQLGNILVKSGTVTAAQLEDALQYQLHHDCRLGEALVGLGCCTDTEIARSLADQLEIPYIDLRETPPSPACVALLSPEIAEAYCALPIRMVGDRLLVAVGDPFDVRADETVRAMTGLNVVIAVAAYSQLREFLQQNTADATVTETAAREMEDPEDLAADEPVSVDQLARISGPRSAVRVVNALIVDAVRKGASDLHIEPEETQIRVRLRIDGHLRYGTTLHRSMLASLVARVKIMCGMDIAESQKPQDGSCRVQVHGRGVELRASTLRGIYGEKVVIRVQTPDARLQSLDSLGFTPDTLRRFRGLLAARQGMLLVTGPTGSGKSTTLYAALQHLNSDEVNITTVEDPVEIKLPGVHQIQVHNRAGRTFATTLRALVRQDPDIIMIGEIRDTETLTIGCRAALTGHLVLSTLHTQHTLNSLARLVDMGVEPWMIAACLNGVIAQRLVRRICENCTQPYDPPFELRRALVTRFGSLEHASFRHGVGCSHCHRSGTRGRVGVYELLAIDDELRHLIAKGFGANTEALQKYVVERGFVAMEEHAFQQACAGEIPPEEVISLGFEAAVALAGSS